MAGRPEAIIDWKEVGLLLEADCTATSIAARIGISTDTLYRRCKSDNNIDFAAFSQQKKESGEALLRKQQFALAMKGNLGMLIWLGKQRLGQKDKSDHTSDDKPLNSLDDARIALLAKLAAQRDAG